MIRQTDLLILGRL